MPGLVPIPAAETPDGGFINAQCRGDPGSGPLLFLTPEDEAPLLGSEPVVLLGRDPVGVPFPEELIQSWLGHCIYRLVAKFKVIVR